MAWRGREGQGLLKVKMVHVTRRESGSTGWLQMGPYVLYVCSVSAIGPGAPIYHPAWWNAPLKTRTSVTLIPLIWWICVPWLSKMKHHGVRRVPVLFGKPTCQASPVDILRFDGKMSKLPMAYFLHSKCWTCLVSFTFDVLHSLSLLHFWVCILDLPVASSTGSRVKSNSISTQQRIMQKQWSVEVLRCVKEWAKAVEMQMKWHERIHAQLTEGSNEPLNQWMS